MDVNEYIVYLLRKTAMPRSELLKLHPQQLVSLYTEVQYQERVDYWDRAYLFASMQATLATLFGKESHKPDEFLGPRPSRDQGTSKPIDPVEDAVKMAESKGIKAPKYKIEPIREEK